MEARLVQQDDAVMLGKPTIVGTRITVELILERLAAGEDRERIREAYPHLPEGATQAVVSFAVGRVRDFGEEQGASEDSLLAAADVLDREPEAPPRRSFAEETRPGVADDVAEKVAPAGVSYEEAMASMERVTVEGAALVLAVASDGPDGRTFAPGHAPDPADVRVALAFASELLRIYRARRPAGRPVGR